MLQIVVDQPTVARQQRGSCNTAELLHAAERERFPARDPQRLTLTRDGMASGPLTAACSVAIRRASPCSKTAWSNGISRNGWNWSHPIHVHMEEHQVVKGAPGLYGSSCDDSMQLQQTGAASTAGQDAASNSPTGVNLARKDTVRLAPKSQRDHQDALPRLAWTLRNALP